MKVLITGATGRVGREVVKQALARGHEAIAGMMQYRVKHLVAVSSQAANVWANQPLFAKIVAN